MANVYFGNCNYYNATDAGTPMVFCSCTNKAIVNLLVTRMFAGCPIRQEIFDSSLATAYGDGLAKGIEDQEATFFVDIRGQRGDLDVRVDGNSHPLYTIHSMQHPLHTIHSIQHPLYTRISNETIELCYVFFFSFICRLLFL